MRTLLGILVTLAVALAVGIFFKNHPGTFVLNYGETTIQASLAFFAAAVILVSVFLAFLLVAVNGMINLPGNYRRWVKHRRNRRSEKYLTRGLMCSLEGNWQQAEQAFRKGAAYSRVPMLNYLGAARAAQQRGEIKQRDHYLRLAHEHSPDRSNAVGLTQAELQLTGNQTEQAYATLKHLDGRGTGQDQANLMLLQASSELKEWHGVLEILPKLEKKKLLRPEEIRAQQLTAYTGLLQLAGNTGDRERLEEVWNNIPRNLQKELYILEVYIKERLRFPGTGDCEVLLRQILKNQWDAAIVRLYGLVKGEDGSKQLAFAERLLKSHARDPILLLTVGRLCRRNSLWGKARTCLEESLAVQPGPEAYQELATLLESQGDHAGAAECYQKGLNLATGVNEGSTGKLLNKPA